MSDPSPDTPSVCPRCGQAFPAVVRLSPTTAEPITCAHPWHDGPATPAAPGSSSPDVAALTVALAAPFVQPGSVVADLSCGNGLIASALAEKAGTTPILGDVAPGWPIQGDLADTIENVGPVDVFVLTETLEHLPDPAAVLAGIQADVLVLSTPVEAWDDREPQHLWAWDRQWISVLATAVGWSESRYVEFDGTVMGDWYRYGIWVLLH